MDFNSLITFSNDQIGEIRGFIKDGQPWFLAGQVCRCLGIKNSRDAVKAVSERYKISEIDDVGITDIIIKDNLGRKQRNTIISESVLYELIFNSRKKKAIKFRTWVTREVLPSIRKQGYYRMEGKLIHRTLTDAVKDKIVPSLESDAGKKFAYSNFQKLINKSLGLPNKVNRDTLSPDQLESLAHRENLVKALIDEGKSYQEIKESVL
jgi:prophage antirepressor-like protein